MLPLLLLPASLWKPKPFSAVLNYARGGSVQGAVEKGKVQDSPGFLKSHHMGELMLEAGSVQIIVPTSQPAVSSSVDIPWV